MKPAWQGRRARIARELIDCLHRLGVKATVGYGTRRQSAKVLFVMPTRGDLDRIPARFAGYRIQLP